MGCYKGVSNIENTAICFKGTVCKNLFTSENFKIYALKVDDEKYPDIKLSEQYGNCIIKGNLHELRIGINYEVTANLIKDKYGYSYNVLNIRRERPNTSLDVQIFLQELLTPKQAETLYNAYPNIVDLVINPEKNSPDIMLPNLFFHWDKTNLHLTVRRLYEDMLSLFHRIKNAHFH